MFGQDGPYTARPGLDRVGIGYGGLLHLTGYPDRPPVRVGVTISDYLTGVFAAQAAVAALYARDARGGGGAVIDAALYGSVLRILEWTLPAYDRLGHRPQPRGQPARQLRAARQLPHRATASTCASSPAPTPTSAGCARRWTGSTCSTTRASRKLVDRAAHGDTINGIVADWTATLDARAVEDRCVAHDVPVATAYTAADIFADPHFDARHDLVTVDDPVVGPLRQQAPYPRRVGETPAAPSGRAPARASTPTRCCSTLLHLSTAEIDALRAKGVV